MAKIRTKVHFKNHIPALRKRVDSVLALRMDSISEQMRKTLQEVLSKQGPSKPGEPPGLTQYPRKPAPGRLKNSIAWVRDGRLTRRIGTSVPYGFWLEMGVAGGVVIRPKRARALVVPIDDVTAQRIREKKIPTDKPKGGFLGMFQDSTGQWFMLRSFVIQGPIAARPWLKPTFLKNLRKIGLTLGQKIY